MARKQANMEEIDRWRRNYWQLRKKYSNKAIANTLDVDPGNLSAMGKGTLNKEGKPKNPGEEFLNHFYMTYAEFSQSNEDQPADSNASNTNKDYEQGGPTSSTTHEPAQVHYLNWDDPVRMRNELFSLYKDNDAFHKTEISKMNNTNLKTAESHLIVSQELAFFRRLLYPEPDNSSRQP